MVDPAKEIRSATPPSSPNALPKALPFERARVVAANVGAELRALRIRLSNEIDQGGAFEAVMAARVGSPRSELPFAVESAIIATSNWGAHLPYPQIAVAPKTGEIYVRDNSRSASWFGPYRPASGALVTEALSEEQKLDLVVLLASKSGAFSP